MLKSLELFGFKSFADRTAFGFSRGITCVVGPNGSGKSNVVDAMKWLLGDQSPKSLRGKDMTDVIFNGSANRKASAFAEATLTFDNTLRILPIETDEVQIGRRLWRNGDSEYLINGATARLKDIRDAFMGTGAGTSAYSIIEQGRVGQILQSNPAARRLVFEEAAGISRFKSKKVEALRKLERVSQNLMRLQDIVDQLESQLNSTRSQAVKAAKYREASNELKQLWLGLAADDYCWLNHRLKQLDRKLGETNQQLEKLNAQQSKIDRRMASFDGEISGVDDKLRDAERSASATREAAVSLETTIRHETSRQRETESELLRLRRRFAGTNSRLREVTLELDAAQTEFDQFDETYAAAQDGVRAAEKQIEQLRQEFSQNRGQIDVHQKQRTALSEQVSKIRQQIALLEAQIRTLEESRERTVEQNERLSSEIVSARTEFNRRQAAVTAVLAEADTLSGAFQEIRRQREELVRQQDETQKKLVEFRERRSGSQARLTVLDDLEQRQEGVGIGVREILNRARTSDYAPWNHILGSVADLLDVELENAALLEVSLGQRAQLIVLDDLDPLVEFLNRGGVRIDGRVGFLSLNECAVSDDVDLSDDPDVICRADSLVSAACSYPALAGQLLGSTWVVTDVDAARRLFDESRRKLRFVTLQGEVVEEDGTLFAGSVRGETAILSRKSELRRLKNDLVRLDQSVEASEKQLAHFASQIAGIDEQLSHATTQRDEINEKLALMRVELDSQKQVVSRLTAQRDEMTSEVQQNLSECEAAQVALSARFDELSNVESRQKADDDEIARLEGALIEIEHERNRLVQLQNEEKLRLARQGERRDTLSTTLERLTGEKQTLTDDAAEATTRLDALEERHRTATLAILNASAELNELAITAEHSSGAVRQLSGEKDRLRLVRAEVVEEETRIRQERRRIADRQHAEEIEAREGRHKLSTCGERIEEEYAMTLDEVVALNVSAFRNLLIQRGLLADPDGNSTDAAASSSDADDDDELEDGELDDVDSDDDASEDADASEDGDESEDDENESEFELAAASEPDDDLSGQSTTSDDLPLVLQEIDGTRYEDVREELEEEVNRLRRKLKSMGSVNTDSLNDLDELSSKFEHFNSQLLDLTEAKNTLEDIIRKINVESRRIFLESFEKITIEFRELFRKLFGGGDGDIILEDPDDVLDCGIDIVARPPGKELRSITLLSGGEKTMTAVALLLAIFKSNPSPFCILDEVDAALDDGNVERYAGVIHDFKEMTQFIVISHRKRTMTVADRIYGVTMEQSGVSKRLTVSFEQVGENGEITANESKAA